MNPSFIVLCISNIATCEILLWTNVNEMSAGATQNELLCENSHPEKGLQPQWIKSATLAAKLQKPGSTSTITNNHVLLRPL